MCWSSAIMHVFLQQLNPIYRDATTTYKNPTFEAVHWRHSDVIVTSRRLIIFSVDHRIHILMYYFVENLRDPFPFSLFLILFSSCSLFSSPFGFISLPPHPFYRSISAKSARVLVECCEFSQSVWAQLYLKLHSVHFKRNRNASGE